MKEQDLLNALQYDFPLTPSPYTGLAQYLGERPEVILERTQGLLDRGILRSIRGFFDAKRLNHRSTLVATHVSDANLEAVAAHVSAHPGVSHNYAREHHYNLWFTLTIPDSIDMRQTVTSLLDGIDDFLLLPAIRLFKIDARFALGKKRSPVGQKAPRVGNSHERFEPNAIDRRAIYALNQRLPIVDLPFAHLAQQFELTEDCLLERARFCLDRGIMRRYGAALNHRRAGFAANGMTGWIVPPQRMEAVGQVFAGAPEVSHCYERPAYPSWPYNLFTMVHGKTRGEVEAIVQGMAQTSGLDEYAILFSTIEFKKTAVSYFDPAMYVEGNQTR